MLDPLRGSAGKNTAPSSPKCPYPFRSCCWGVSGWTHAIPSTQLRLTFPQPSWHQHPTHPQPGSGTQHSHPHSSGRTTTLVRPPMWMFRLVACFAFWMRTQAPSRSWAARARRIHGVSSHRHAPVPGTWNPAKAGPGQGASGANCRLSSCAAGNGATVPKEPKVWMLRINHPFCILPVFTTPITSSKGGGIG